MTETEPGPALKATTMSNESSANSNKLNQTSAQAEDSTWHDP
jgi:hypothetical protein